ncbi:ANTAR domain-containing protein [Nocardioides piscis]|uniref:ANTAR domain-containing protein n=1 Tax=Nocardioides piscis TaxID=2714938 RepID=A0A6G7YE07_9ACTN|nr:ANTAR domain-containing protein [Nocardioides piscis]QIK75052.1 ANTAR domain-containing protein [Nocardioides piscis]
MSNPDDLLVRLARAIATTPATDALSERLCLASRDLAGADAAALTVVYAQSDRVTLCATDAVSARLEDLQDVMGEGPGLSAVIDRQVTVCALGTFGAQRWPGFAEAAVEVAGPLTVHAVPMLPADRPFGVMTLYQVEHTAQPLALDRDTLLRLASATGAALIRDPQAVEDDLDRGPWSSRAKVHQATGMVVAQLGLGIDDALAVLKAHAYAGDTTLDDVATHVLDHTIRFHQPGSDDD